MLRTSGLSRWSLLLLLGVLLARPAAAQQLRAPEAVRGLLERHLQLEAGTRESQDATQWASRERRLRKEAGVLLSTEGYFSPRIELRADESGEVLVVEPGNRARIGRVHIEVLGQLSDERRQALIATWSLPRGSAFRQARWDEAKQALLGELLAVDHAGARLVSSQAEVEIDGDDEATRVDLSLVYAAGPRYRYGDLRIVGLQRYPASLVERYTRPLKRGDAYRQEDLLAAQSALQNTPYFSAASIETEVASTTDDRAEAVPDAAEDFLPLLVRVQERQPYHVALGAGVSSNTGARVEATFRNADFMGRAWALSTGVRLEQLRQSAYADLFFAPEGRQRRDSVGALAEKSDIQGLAIERMALAMARVQQRGSIEQRLGLNWQHERQTPDGAEMTVNRALTATAGWLWRHADAPRDASEGIVAQVQLAGAAKALLSDQNFLRTYVRYSQGIPLGKSDSLLLRGEVGVTAAPSRQGIPQDYLFRAGGSNSVRGYAYQSLGVQEGGATLGGRYLLTLSVEYTHWLDARWGLAVFADAGQAADDREVFKLAPGYGAGARWKSPAGPLALDVAWGQREQQWRVHFSLAVPF